MCHFDIETNESAILVEIGKRYFVWVDTDTDLPPASDPLERRFPLRYFIDVRFGTVQHHKRGCRQQQFAFDQ